MILLNTGDPSSGPMIEASIKKLGFDPKDIVIMINGHGHSDHTGGFAYLKKLTGAKLAIMEGDVAMVEDGGKSDFHYGHDWKIMGQAPVKVDRVLSNGDRVALGDVTLTAYNPPGHTRGSTTWVTQVVENGKAYSVVFPDGAGFNPGYKLTGDEADYPGIGDGLSQNSSFFGDVEARYVVRLPQRILRYGGQIRPHGERGCGRLGRSRRLSAVHRLQEACLRGRD